MRALFSSTRGAGHFHQMIPFARPYGRAGHEVLFAGRRTSPARSRLREAIGTVLADASYGARAQAMAEQPRSEPPVDEAVALLERLDRS